MIADDMLQDSWVDYRQTTLFHQACHMAGSEFILSLWY